MIVCFVLRGFSPFFASFCRCFVVFWVMLCFVLQGFSTFFASFCQCFAVFWVIFCFVLQGFVFQVFSVVNHHVVARGAWSMPQGPANGGCGRFAAELSQGKGSSTVDGLFSSLSKDKKRTTINK